MLKPLPLTTESALATVAKLREIAQGVTDKGDLRTGLWMALAASMVEAYAKPVHVDVVARAIHEARRNTENYMDESWEQLLEMDAAQPDSENDAYFELQRARRDAMAATQALQENRVAEL